MIGPLKRHILLLIAVTGVRIFCGLAVVKALSLLLSAQQFGQITQLLGIVAAIYTLAGGAITNGLTVATGAHEIQEEKDRWLASAALISFVTSLILAGASLLIYIFANEQFLGSGVVRDAFLAVAIVQVIMGFGNLIFAYASAQRNIPSFAAANISGTLLGTLTIITLTLISGFVGAVWASAIAPIFPAVLILYNYRSHLARIYPLAFTVDWRRIRALLTTGIYLGIGICALPIANATVRADFATRTSWIDVGLWQSVVRLSDAYMQVFAVLTINLFLPRLLEQNTLLGARRIMLYVGSLMIFLALAGGALLLPFRESVLQLAYSSDYLLAAKFIAPQFFGDLGKVAAWIFVYRFIAVQRFAAQPAAEIIQATTFVAFYFIIANSQGAMAPVLSHVASCLVTATAMLLAAWRFRVL